MERRADDRSCRIAVGSGDLRLVKGTESCALFAFDDRGIGVAAQCGEPPFMAHCLLLTVDGVWTVRAPEGPVTVDRDRAVVGEAGEFCPGGAAVRHLRRQLLTLKPAALDPDFPLFSRTVICAGSLPRLARTARLADDDDAFDTLVYTAFDEASLESLGCTRRDSRVRMQRLKRFIERHAFEPVTLHDMAGELGLSPFTTVRAFRAATGTTPYAYLLELRFQRALRLLAKKTDPIASIAHEIGFDQHPHFTRWFTRRAGMSPTLYRTRQQRAPRTTAARTRT
jgi:AraC-like DNA-binding protein